MSKRKSINNKKLFYILLPYMRMLYHEGHKEKYEKIFMRMYKESQKKNPNYAIVKRIPSEYKMEAIRYTFPGKLDYTFVIVLFLAIFTWMYYSDFKNKEYAIYVLGAAGVIYGALYAVFSDLARKGPKIKSLRYLRDTKSKTKTAVNVINTLMFWMFVAVAIQGIAGMILMTINYIAFTLFSGIFAFLFYKVRYTP